MSINGPSGSDGQQKPVWDLVTDNVGNSYKPVIPGVTDNNGNVPVAKAGKENSKGVTLEATNWQNIPPKKEPTDRKGETKITYGNGVVAYVRDYNNGYSKPFWHGKAEEEKDQHIIITKGEKIYIPGNMHAKSNEEVLQALEKMGLACSQDGLEVRKGSNNRGLFFTSCATKDEPTTAKTGTIVYVNPTEVIPAVLTEDDQRIFNDAMNSAIDKEVKTLNDAKPKTKDGLGYTYSVNADYNSGSIKIDGTEIVLPFDVVKDGDAKKQDDGGLLLTANIHGTPKDKVIIPSTVVDYITAIGGEHKTGETTYKFSKDGDNAKVTYDNGFTHIVGEPADLQAASPVGQLQAAMGRLQLNAGNKLVTKMESGPAADDSNIGIKYELKGGDLKDITTGNPEVKFSVGNISVEGKVSAKDGVVTITGQDGKTVTIKPETIDNMVNDYVEGLTITSSDGKKYEIAYDPELTNPITDEKDGKYCTIREVKNGKRGTETFFKVDGNTFGCKEAVDDADNYFNEKKINLETAYQTAVDKFKTSAEYYKGPETITHTFVAEADARVTFKWKWPWQ